MTSMYEHATPRPWKVVPATIHHGPYIVSQFGNSLADLYTMTYPGEPSTASGGRSEPMPFMAEMADPNAALIVHAVNNIERLETINAELLEALTGVAELLVATVAEFGCWTAEDHPKVIAARAAIASAQRIIGEGE